jgi:hypothetical protein
MEFFVFVYISWFIIVCFALIPKRHSFVENLFFFLAISSVVINSFTIIGFELKLIISNKKPDIQLALIIYRSIIIPVLLLIFINLLKYFTTRIKKVGTFFVISFVFIGIEFLTVQLNLQTYKNWSFYLSYLLIIFYFIFSYFLAKVFNLLEKRSF